MKQLTLGELVKKLSTFPAGDYIAFDFAGLCPVNFNSFRGYYDQIALGFSVGGTAKVGDVLGKAKLAIGDTFEGYKGGQYKMTAETPVWVANYGDSTSTGLVDVISDGYQCILVTSHVSE